VAPHGQLVQQPLISSSNVLPPGLLDGYWPRELNDVSPEFMDSALLPAFMAIEEEEPSKLMAQSLAGMKTNSPPPASCCLQQQVSDGGARFLLMKERERPLAPIRPTSFMRPDDGPLHDTSNQFGHLPNVASAAASASVSVLQPRTLPTNGSTTGHTMLQALTVRPSLAQPVPATSSWDNEKGALVAGQLDATPSASDSSGFIFRRPVARRHPSFTCS
jgi:hypothetical protein